MTTPTTDSIPHEAVGRARQIVAAYYESHGNPFAAEGILEGIYCKDTPADVAVACVVSALSAPTDHQTSAPGGLSAADEAQMALCQLSWIEEGKDPHPRRIECIRKALERLARTQSAPQKAEPVAVKAHPDDLAVDRFAVAMKAKLAQKRAQGRGGWDRKDECSSEFLSRLLREHVEKGDPLDVGNLAMMLHQRGERII